MLKQNYIQFNFVILIKQLKQPMSLTQLQNQKQVQNLIHSISHPKSDIPLAKDISLDTYNSQPIEGYGQKLLKLQGWIEGQAIGRSTTSKIIKPIVYIPRQPRSGLGATCPNSAALPGSKEYKSYQGGKLSRNYQFIDEQLKQKQQLQVGSHVYIQKGKHSDLYGCVVNFNTLSNQGLNPIFAESNTYQNKIVVQLDINGQQINVNESDVILSREKESNNRSNDKKKKISQQKPLTLLKKRSNSIQLLCPPAKQSDKKQNKKHQTENKRSKKLKWVRPDCKVRVISKKYRDGLFYNCKITIQDVLNKYSFTAIDQKSGVLLEDLRQKYLETLIPNRGENIMALSGRFRGQVGTLIEKDKQKQKCKIQLGSGQIISLSHDDCCATIALVSQ